MFYFEFIHQQYVGLTHIVGYECRVWLQSLLRISWSNVKCSKLWKTCVKMPSLHRAVVQKPALLCLLPSLCGDTGQLDHATHHAEIQRQPGCCQKRQPQPGGLCQGLLSLSFSPVSWAYFQGSLLSPCSDVSTWWTEGSFSNKSTTTWTVSCLETRR